MNSTTFDRQYLGSPIGCCEFIDQYVTDKVNQWNEELLLSKIAVTQPHAVPDISPHPCPLEFTFRSKLVLTLTGRPPPNDLEWNIFAMPARLGGLGIINPTILSSVEYSASVRITAPLRTLILEQSHEYTTLNALINSFRPRRKSTKANETK